MHLLFDALGSGRIDGKSVKEMKAAGVEVETYNPWRWNTLARINNRTHRKIMVVDGRIGYTGGAGIADWIEVTGNVLRGEAYFPKLVRAGSHAAHLKRSRRVSLEEWESRPWTEKLWEPTMGLLSSQL